jgi:hypothetical protein
MRSYQQGRGWRGEREGRGEVDEYTGHDPKRERVVNSECTE